MSEEEGSKSEQEAQLKHNIFRSKRLEQVPDMKLLLSSDNPGDQLEGMKYFHRLLSFQFVVVVDELLVPDVLCRCIELLAPQHPLPLRRESIATLAYMASDDAPNAHRIMMQEAVEPLLAVLTDRSVPFSGSSDVLIIAEMREHALHIIGNIATDVTSHPGLYHFRLVDCLLQQLGMYSEQAAGWENPSLKTMQRVAWIAVNLLRESVNADDIPKLLAMLAVLLQSPDEEVVNSSFEAFQLACKRGPDMINLVLQQGVLSRVKEVTSGPVVANSIRDSSCLLVSTIINCGLPIHAAAVLWSDRNGPLLALLVSALCTSTEEEVVKEVCRAATTLTGGQLLSFEQLSPCFSGLVAGLCRALETGKYEVCVEAGLAICWLCRVYQPQQICTSAVQLMRGLGSLLDTVDQSLLLNVLQCLQMLVTWLRSQQLSASGEWAEDGCFRKKLDLLSCHPLAEEANRLEQMIEQLY